MLRNKICFILLASLFVMGMAGCGGGVSTVESSNGSTLTAISVTPTNPAIANNTAQQLTATGIYSDNTKQDLTNTVTWSSSDTTVATISGPPLSSSKTNNGNAYAYGKNCGKTTVSATSGSTSGSTTLTVNCTSLVSIAITPVNPSIAYGTTEQFVATGTFSDNTTQDLTLTSTWASSNTGVATINAGGLATSVTAGTTTITVTWGTISGSTTLTVNPATLSSISVTPTNPSIPDGMSKQFVATGTYSDNTTQNLTASVGWLSSNAGVAMINAPGLIKAVAAGSATITATLGSKSASSNLIVTPATLASISISPSNPTNAKGTTRQFTATGTYSDGTTQDLTASVTWSSSNATVSTISNAAGSNGLASCLAAGTSTITATSGSVAGSTTLTVTPATLSSLSVTPSSPTNAKGTTRQFTATGTYSDGTKLALTPSVTWSSSNATVSTISNAAGSNGLASCLVAGTSTITATSGSVTGSTTLTVTPATLVSIAVTPATASIAQGTTKQFAASGTYSDGTTQVLTGTVTWNSSNTGVATVSNAAGSNGLATAVAAGTTTITATSGGVSATAGLTVTAITTGSATLSWNAPTTNTDGTPLTDLAGYKVHMGTSSGNYTTVVDIGNVMTYTVSNLAPGTYYFVVTAYDSSSNESSFSNEASKTI